jgi:predicted ArsR family transcriptional regulator
VDGEATPNDEVIGTWTFLTNHAHVLLCLARDPEARARDIAERVGITERAAQRVVSDLIKSGYVERTKHGRRNSYRINTSGHLRHPVFRHFTIGPLLEILETHATPAGAKETSDRTVKERH